jgi:general secretion pathway protein M
VKRALPHPLLLAAGGLAALVGLYLWIVVPVVDGLDARKRRLAEAGRSLEEAKRLAGQLAALSQTPAAPPVPEGFSLFSLVEGVASREGVKGNVEFMRPASRDLGGGRREAAVDLRLTSLTMDKLLAFLQQVESPARGIRVRQLILTPSAKGGIDADLSVAMPQPADKPR